MGTYTIVVPDTSVLRRVCGTNDTNLRLIESFLGKSVFARGNELSIEDDDPEKNSRFRFIIDRVLDEMEDGDHEDSDAHLIQSVLSAELPSGKGETFVQENFTSSIEIPGSLKKVYPRTKGQGKLVSLLRSCSMVFATGPAGSGKTFLSVCEALRMLLNHEVSSVILTRPVVEAGESLGFLPGALEDKINPYMRPLLDAVNWLLPRDTVKRLMEAGSIEIAPLAYMRGRTLNDAAVILDEAQNTTRTQMKMFLTRLGENAKMFITGDVTQIDLPPRTPSGLIEALELLEGVDGIGMAELDSTDVVRNVLVRRIIKAYEDKEE